MGRPAETPQQLCAAAVEERRRSVQSLRGHSLAETGAQLILAMADDNWRVRKEAVEIFVAGEPDQNLIGELLELFRDENNAGLRNSAAEAIVRLGERAVEPLIRLSGDSDADVRKFVIDTMGAIGSQRFFTVLLAALHDPDVNVAAAAAEQVGNFADSAAIQELIKALISNSSLLFRFSALAALGKLRGHLPVPDEIIDLANDEILRKRVYECLGNIGNATACPILREGFQSHRTSSRAAAVISWYRIYSRSAPEMRHELESGLRQLSGSPVVAQLVELVPADGLDLAEALTVLFGIIGDVRALPALLLASADEHLATLALSSLKQFGASGLEALVAFYTQADDVSRAAICSVVGELRYCPGSGVIRQGLRDPSSSVRTAAVTSAALLGLKECIPAIAGQYATAGGDMRMTVSAALQTLAASDRAAVLNEALRLGESGLPEDRREAALLHTALGDGEQLFLLTKDEEPAVRQAAIAGLGTLRRVEHAGLIQVALADEAPQVRIAAAEALGAFGSHNLLDSLIAALHDEDVWVQCAVLRNIDRIDRTCLLPHLEALSARAEGILMLTCLELLEQINSPAALAQVASALTHRDDDIVALAAAILERQEKLQTI